MWGFCDNSNHDPDAPTPHNLICCAKSVWDVMRHHPDFSEKLIHHNEENSTRSILPTNVENDTLIHLKDNNTNQSYDSVIVPDFVNESQGNETDLSVEHNNPLLDILNSSSNPLFLDDVRNHLQQKLFSIVQENLTAHPNDSETNYHLQGQRSKRNSNVTNTMSSISLRPSLVTAHIATSSPEPELSQEVEEIELVEVSFIPGHTGFKDLPLRDFQERKIQPKPKEHLPKKPTLRFLASAPSAVILALDLSDKAVAQVNMDDLRGGILRWLWGLGADVKVGVLGAYNNASYPLTLGPLLPAPTTAAELEDELTLLPSADEVEDGVYGGEYCLGCVLTEAVKMLQGGNVDIEAGVVLLAACSPSVPSLSNIVEADKLLIQTLALCPSANPGFDQLAQSGGSWVLPGLIGDWLNPEDEDEKEHHAAISLSAATKTILGAPGCPTLVR
ncbi:hypothetical protein SK128_020792, partial [Halocaridina rubra]